MYFARNKPMLIDGTEAKRLHDTALDLYENLPELKDGVIITSSLYKWLERANVLTDDYTLFVLAHQKSTDDHSSTSEHSEFVSTLPLMSCTAIKEMYEDCKRIEILKADRQLNSPLGTRGLYEKDGSLGCHYESVDELYRWNFTQVRAIMLKYATSTRNNIPEWMAK